MDRRKFLTVTGAAGVAAVWGGSLAGCASSGTAATASSAKFPLSSVGLQLYTMRNLMDKDVDGTLAKVAAAGYQLVETAGLYGLTATQLRAQFDKHGIRSVSGHYPITELEGASDVTFANAKTLGQEYVVMPWLEPALRTPEVFKGMPDRLNKLGEKARSAGLKLAYHNHDFEFALDGALPVLDTLIARTDPTLVTFELDGYWVYKAGFDPVHYFEKYPGRIAMLHLKDGSPPPEKAIVDVGKGTINFDRLIRTAKANGMRYAFVEHDSTTDPVATIRASHDYLATLLTARA